MSKLPYLFVLMGLVVIGSTGALYVNNLRSENVASPAPKSSVSPSASIQAIASTAVTNTPYPSGSVSPSARTIESGLKGYTLVPKNDIYKLSDQVDMTILGGYIATEEEIKLAETGFGSQIVKPGNGALVVMYSLLNKTATPQAIFHRIGDETVHPFMVFDSKSRIDFDNDMMAFTVIVMDSIAPRANEQSGMLFEIPKSYSSVEGLNFVAEHAAFKPAKGYTPLFQLSEALRKQLGSPSIQ